MSSPAFGVLAVYACGSQRPDMDPAGQCPDCGADLVDTERLDDLAEAMAETDLCSTGEYEADIEIEATVTLDGFTQDRAADIVYATLENIERQLELAQGVAVDDIAIESATFDNTRDPDE